MGIAAVSSPKTAPTGTRKIAPKRNAIIAGTGPPPTTIQSPTCRTQPVPMMAPKPMVKKFQSESVFFIPPLSSTATSAFLSAIVPLLSFLTPLDVTPCAVCFAALFYFVALRYGLGAAAPLVARPKAELYNERHRFWDERRGAPLVASARFDDAIRSLAEGATLWRQARSRSCRLPGFCRTHSFAARLFCRMDGLYVRRGGTDGIRIQRRRTTAKRSPCRAYHANIQECF